MGITSCLVILACLVHVAVLKPGSTCTNACGVKQDNTGEGTQLLKFLCHCIAEQKLDTMPPPTTTTTTTTRKPDTTIDTDQICDYLCSIQMGGDACKCSNPSLPGK